MALQKFRNLKWQPVVSIPDYSGGYLKNWPIDYRLSENPLTKNLKLDHTIPFTEEELFKGIHVPMVNETKSREDALEELIHPKEISENIMLRDSIPALTSVRETKRRNREERNKSLLKWFDLPRQELTEEKKQDLEILRMRQSLDPKHFYKRPDRNTDLKYFQSGRFADEAHDYYNRLSRKQRKNTLVEELLDNENFMNKQKKRYQKIKGEKLKRDRAFQMKQKRLNKHREKGKKKTKS